MIWPFSSRIARSQNSVTYGGRGSRGRPPGPGRSARGRGPGSGTGRPGRRCRGPRRAGGCPGVIAVAIEKPRRAFIPDRVGLDGSVDERPDVGELDDRRREPVHLRRARSRGRRRPGRCCRARSAPGRSPAPRVSRVDTRPSIAIAPSLGCEDPGQGQEERALAGTVRARSGRSPRRGPSEGPGAGAPRSGSARPVAPQHAGERPLDGGPPRQAQVVVDPQVADVDGDGARSRARSASSEDPRERGLDPLEDGDREHEEDHRDDEQDPEREEVRPVPWSTVSVPQVTVGRP